MQSAFVLEYIQLVAHRLLQKQFCPGQPLIAVQGVVRTLTPAVGISLQAHRVARNPRHKTRATPRQTNRRRRQEHMLRYLLAFGQFPCPTSVGGIWAKLDPQVSPSHQWISPPPAHPKGECKASSHETKKVQSRERTGTAQDHISKWQWREGGCWKKHRGCEVGYACPN